MKACLFYKFPFNLNPSDIPNDAQARNNDSSTCPIITEDQFQAYSKRLMGH